MNFRRIAASAASLFLLFAVPIAVAGQYSVSVGTTAYADYEFDYIGDDTDVDDVDIDEIEIDDIELDDEDISYSSSYDSRSSERSFNPVKSFIISLIIGLVAAFIAVSIMKSSMKSVHKQTGAAVYRKENSLKLRVNDDTYLGVKTEKSPIARTNTAPPNHPNVRK